MPPRDALHFPQSSSHLLLPYLPPQTPSPQRSRPHLTLTYATSLDASLALSPGTQTALSGPLSKAMTHHLRASHAAILIGAGTAIADDPSLNCRIAGVGGYGGEGLTGQPVPVVLDPRGRWDVRDGSKVVRLAGEGRGRGPIVLVGRGHGGGGEEKRRVLESVGGKVVEMGTREGGRFEWEGVLDVLVREGLGSVMVEGGGSVINELLSARYAELVDSVIVTIAPVWLGTGGVQVCPEARSDPGGEKIAVGRLEEVRWVPLGEDVVLCGKPKRE